MNRYATRRSAQRQSETEWKIGQAAACATGWAAAATVGRERGYVECRTSDSARLTFSAISSSYGRKA